MKKQVLLLIALLLCGSVLTGCKTTSANESMKNWEIKESEARANALDSADLSEEDVSSMTIEKAIHEGQNVYHIVFDSEDRQYEYFISRQSGEILHSSFAKLESADKESDKDDTDDKDNKDSDTKEPVKTDSQADSQTTQNQTTVTQLTKDQAISKAYAHAGVSSGAVNKVTANLDRDDGVLHYDVDFTTADHKYEYDIKASDGSVLEYDKEAIQKPSTQNTANPSTDTSKPAAQLSKTEALAKAYAYADAKESQVQLLEAKKESDDGRTYYEVKFIFNNQKYDIDVNVESGKITDCDVETIKETASTNSQKLSKSEALALIQAKVKGVDTSRIEIELDEDDGKMVYEGEFYHNGKEYEFEMNAKTGAFLEWNVEDADDD